MFEEHEDDRPEWEEVPDEEIPPSLEKKWNERTQKGLRAGICRQCGNLYGDEDLVCIHCGFRTSIEGGRVSGLKDWLLTSPFGIIGLVIILTGIILYLVF